MTAPQTPAHTTVQCVTVEGLLESHAALERLMTSTRDRIRDELARKYGVSVGDRVEYIPDLSPHPSRLWVLRMFGIVVNGSAQLHIVGCAVRKEDDEHGFKWNPTTCRVIRKGGGA